MPAETAAPAQPWRRLFIVFAWLLLGAVVVVTLGPLGMRPSVLDSAQIERLAAFFVVGAAFGMAYPRHPWVVLLIVVGAAGLLEAAQLLEPHRHGRWPDMAVKMAGGMVGVGLAMLVNRLIEDRSR